MAAEQTPKKKRGPKGAIKHAPGRDHDRKSAVNRKKRFARKAANKRQQQDQATQQAWQAWDALSDDAKRLLGPNGVPKTLRPDDD